MQLNGRKVVAKLNFPRNWGKIGKQSFKVLKDSIGKEVDLCLKSGQKRLIPDGLKLTGKWVSP